MSFQTLNTIYSFNVIAVAIVLFFHPKTDPMTRLDISLYARWKWLENFDYSWVYYSIELFSYLNTHNGRMFSVFERKHPESYFMKILSAWSVSKATKRNWNQCSKRDEWYIFVSSKQGDSITWYRFGTDSGCICGSLLKREKNSKIRKWEKIWSMNAINRLVMALL